MFDCLADVKECVPKAVEFFGCNSFHYQGCDDEDDSGCTEAPTACIRTTEEVSFAPDPQSLEAKFIFRLAASFPLEILLSRYFSWLLTCT